MFRFRTPEFKRSFRELASPLSVLHDHPYSQLMRKAWKKQVPAKILCDMNSHYSPLTPEDIVCKRNGLTTNFEKRAVVETDFVARREAFSLRRGERNAKFLARLRMSDSSQNLAKRPREFVSNSKKKPQPKKKSRPKKKMKVVSNDLASPTESSSFSYTPLLSPLQQLEMSPSLISHAQNCSVGITPADTSGVYSPLCVSSQTDSSDSGSSSSTGLSSRASSLSPSVHQVVRPFTISLQRMPLTHLSHLEANIALE